MHIISYIHSTKQLQLTWQKLSDWSPAITLSRLSNLAFHSSVVVRVNLNRSESCWTRVIAVFDLM